MKLFTISFLAGVLLSVQASPKPGGYLLKGGVNPGMLSVHGSEHFRPAQEAGRPEIHIDINRPTFMSYQ